MQGIPTETVANTAEVQKMKPCLGTCLCSQALEGPVQELSVALKGVSQRGEFRWICITKFFIRKGGRTWHNQCQNATGKEKAQP